VSYTNRIKGPVSNKNQLHQVFCQIILKMLIREKETNPCTDEQNYDVE
jgi:hypothetical protein